MMSALSRARTSTLFLLIASAAILGTAFVSQYVGGLDPCILCLYQRIPYATTIALAIIGLSMSDNIQMIRIIHGMAAAVFLVGAGIAAYHVGVEQAWWAGTAECTGAAPSSAQTVDELRSQIMAAPGARCDEIAWSLFGISMSGYNLLASLALAGYAVMASWKNLQQDTS
jgi:disulfide bond formation protein DsbB